MDDEIERAARAKIGSPFLNTDQAAYYLGLSPRRLQELRYERKGPRFRRHSRFVQYHIDDLTPGPKPSRPERRIVAERPGRLSGLPLFRWGTERRAVRARRTRRARRIAALVTGLALVASTIASPPSPRLVWNASASAPIGLYGVTPGVPVRPGDMVVARTPAGARDFAARRRYLPANVPLIKRITAVEHDTVCALGPEIRVNGRRVAMRLPRDGKGRAMPWWTGCHVLGEGQLFLLMTMNPASFDGRYFGVTDARDVIGRAHLLWAR